MSVDTDPDHIGRYEIKGLIARGGMGRVYLARDPNTSRLVVVKLLDATLDSSELRDRFDREAKALAALSHPSIVRIYDYGDFEESPFIVMEYVRGETLEEKIKRREPVPVSRKLKLMSELCAGLAHAHQSGIIHRDVKPANLMVDEEQRLKILDFGIARIADSSLTRGASPARIRRLQIGTPGYMSPEQTQGRVIDQRTDTFAVGAVCYELFAYRPAFPGATPADIESRVMRTPPEPFGAQLRGLDPEIDTILARALARNPDDRFDDVAELGAAFERCRLRTDASASLPESDLADSAASLAGGAPLAPAETAYGRAMAAYQARSLDAARRFAVDAQAEDPRHAGARELLARLDSERTPSSTPTPTPAASPARAVAAPLPPTEPVRWPAPAQPRAGKSPEATSIDPTILIARASRPAASQAIDPTVIVRREDILPGGFESDRTIMSPPPARRPPVAPTVLVPPRPRPASPPPPTPMAPRASGQSVWQRLTSLGGVRRPATRAARSAGAPARRSGLWTPATRGGLIAIGAVAIAAVLVLGAVRFFQWVFAPGQQLTLTPPENGTLVGGGLQCGTRGTSCSGRRPEGEFVEFMPVPDSNYRFSRFTGNCAPTGRVEMAGPRTCGVVFDLVAAPVEGAIWTLTVAKPDGGTIVGPAGSAILCGKKGDVCTQQVANGQPVFLGFEPEDTVAFVRWTGECDAEGVVMMTAPRTCAAQTQPKAPGPSSGSSVPPTMNAGMKREAGTRVIPLGPSAVTPPAVPPPPGPTGPPPGPATAGPATNQTAPPGPASPPSSPQGTNLPVEPPKEVATAKTPEQYAKEDIEKLVNTYCAELETLQPSRIMKLHPQANERSLKEQFKQYKSLKCTIVPPINYDRLEPGPAGGAQIRFGMKQLIQYSIVAPKVQEYLVTMRVNRLSARAPWLIDFVKYEEKPKE